MTTASFPLEDYLKRLHLSSQVAKTEEGLRTLTKAQAFHVPFENMDPLLGKSPSLQIQDLCEKILTQQRGGYCFELNGLLHAALKELGFETQTLLARVNYRRPEPGPRTHNCLIAKVGNQEFLVDAGFGGPGLTEPIPLEPLTVFKQNGTEFRLVHQEGQYQLQRLVKDEWINLYCFDRGPVLAIDLEMSNHFTATWGRSPFRNTLICAIPFENGMLSLNTKELITLKPDLTPAEQQTLESAVQVQEILKTKFKLDVTKEMSEKIFERIK